MTKDTITALRDPNGFSTDPLTDLIRSGARQLIQQALEAELTALLAQFSDETTPAGHARLVRHGHLPEREVMTGVGPVAVKVPRVRDRGEQAEKVRFTSSILPPYLRKAKSVEELLPWLYLKGISTGDFQEALARTAWSECGGSVVHDDFAAEGRLVGGLRALAKARSQHPTHRLCLGGRRVFSAKNGGKTMRSCADRRR